MDPLTRFSRPTRAWFRSAFQTPTEVQGATWPHAQAREHVLAVAPTGSGKTLAAFLWAIDRCLDTANFDGVRVLYVSPLKALATDVERNLRAPLAGIRAQALRLGQPECQVRVGIRTGDTTAAERAAMIRRPPDILITTPESLFLLLTSQARNILGNVETVIVDELHAVAGSKRGAHLAVSLARLDHAVGGIVPRIGLSATIQPLTEAARFLAPGRHVHIVATNSPKAWNLSLQVPVPDMSDFASPILDRGDQSGSIWPHVEERIVDLVQAHRSTLVFANSRRLAERLTARLNEIHSERESAKVDIDTAIEATPVVGRASQVEGGSGVGSSPSTLLARAHHGSVSREQRSAIEEDLKAGRLRAVVATSSLELGIDMGAIDLVIQVEAPPSVSSGLQRVGRAGHQVGAVSEGVLLPKFRSDLLASTVVLDRMRTGQLEALRIPENPLDVLAQQVVAMVAMDDWSVPDLCALITGTAPFQELSEALLHAVLEMLSGKYPSDAFAELRPRMIWDRTLDILRTRPGAQRLAVTSGGTIPDRGLFTVKSPTGGRVGELDEEMVYESRVGDVIALGATSWRIVEITHDSVHVAAAPGAPGRLPFWRGDALGRSVDVGRAVGLLAGDLETRTQESAMPVLLAMGLDEWAAQNLLAYISEQAGSGSAVPTDSRLVLERNRDELGDWRLTLLSPFGARLHAPWAMIARDRLLERFGVDAAVQHGDDGIVVRLPDMPGEGWVADATRCLFPPADEVEGEVARLVGASALFAARFREAASRALLLPRTRPGTRAPLWQQRQRSAQLLQIAADFPTFPIVLEAVRECLQDVFDVSALVDLMSRVEQGRVRVIETAPSEASPFARSLLFGYIADFMYEGDSPLAERRAAALSLDPRLLADLLGQTDLRELLEPEAIEQVEANLQRLSPERQARSIEEGADILRTLGPLDETAAGARGIRPEWLSTLEAQRRIFPTRIAGERCWAVAEDAARLRDTIGAPIPHGLAQVHLEPVRDPVGDLVYRYARTHGPFTTDRSSRELGLPGSLVLEKLLEAAAAGKLLEGRFLPGESGTQFVHIDVLRLIKRRSVALLRDQMEPVATSTLGVFLPRWHGMGAARANRLRGIDGTLEAVRRLSGAPLATSVLEDVILAGRVSDYSPRMLDELTSSGEVVWSGFASLPGGDSMVVLTTADAPSLLPRRPVTVESPLVSALMEILLEGGGWSLSDLRRRLQLAPDDAEVAGALRELVWNGHVSSDTLDPVRHALGRNARRSPTVGARRSPWTGRTARGGYARLWSPDQAGHGRVVEAVGRGLDRNELPGRWFALPPTDLTATEAAVISAGKLLTRFGLVTRGSVLSSGEPGGFAAAYRTLVAMADAGRVQRVYAVEGLGAAQFALAGVVEELRAIEGVAREGAPEIVVLATSDPANPYGAALDWPSTHAGSGARSGHRPIRAAGCFVVLRRGDPVLYVERGGRSLATFHVHLAETESEEDALLESARALARSVKSGMAGSMDVQKINGSAAVAGDGRSTSILKALEDAGFTPTPRGVRLRA
jgi:ATP-dependent helicase Lhr and Lhr-like helicase